MRLKSCQGRDGSSLLRHSSPRRTGCVNYCESPYQYRRRVTREVMVGRVGIGGANPIRVQSMITCDTMDTEASIAQTVELAETGCEIVRITAPTVKDAANLKNIVRGLRERDCEVPSSLTFIFKPEAAMEAARWVEKVRINPGNYATRRSSRSSIHGRTVCRRAGTNPRALLALVKLCKELGARCGSGTNHGSLSDRIMNRYGDTPLGWWKARSNLRGSRAISITTRSCSR